MAQAPMVGMLTDFGLTDGYVGVMKAVLLSIAPGVQIVDITHDVRPQDIEMGAWSLGIAWRYFPVGSVLLCVVDPGVGSARRAIALQAHGRYFVGPDNGLFTSPLLAGSGAGEAAACVRLDNVALHLSGASATFHGRDIFAPCAAHLANGMELAALGSPVAPNVLIRLPIPLAPRKEGDTWIGRIAHVDHYGNLISDLGPGLARQALAAPEAFVEVAGHVVSARATHFAGGPFDQPFFLQDSSGALAIVVRDGSAARMLEVHRGEQVILRGLDGAEGT